MNSNMNFQFSIFNFQKYGFTLIETMVAVTILTLAVAGPLFTASRAIVAAQNARDQLTASYLAQESIEYVRMMRDNEYLTVHNQPNSSTLAWTNFLTAVAQCHTAPKICTLGLIQGGGVLPLVACLGNVCTTSFSLLPQGTQFIRTVQVIDASVNGATDVRIISRVTWLFHSTQYAVSITDHLTPWQ